jgi:NAD-dependent dihydropyrimidine dehydrogenase PreA subunit
MSSHEKWFLNRSFNPMLMKGESRSLSDRLRFFLGKLVTKSVSGRFWGSTVIPINYAIDSSTQILSGEEVLGFAQRSPIKAIGDCYCRKTYGNKYNLPMRTCLFFSDSVILEDLLQKDGMSNLNLAKVSYDEIKRTLEECEKVGLVHQTVYFPSKDTVYVICNCHPSSCVMLQGMIKYGVKSVVKSKFIVSFSRDTCIGCGKCVERCYFGANIEKGKMIEYDYLKCFGCGLCVTSCPTKSRILVRRGGRILKFPMMTSK